MMIPELKLFAATMPAIGMASPITRNILFHSLTFAPIRVISTARKMIRAIFTNSVGWKLREPTPSHRFLPFTSLPTRVTAIIST